MTKEEVIIELKYSIEIAKEKDWPQVIKLLTDELKAVENDTPTINYERINYK